MWLNKGSFAIIAGTNHRISKTEERLQSTECLLEATEPSGDKSEYLALFESSHEQKHVPVYNYQALMATHQIYRPRLCKTDLHDCPTFNNSISTTAQNKSAWRPEAIGRIRGILHRELPRNEASQYTHLLSECNKSFIQSSYSPVSNLLTFSELEVLSTSHKHTPTVDYVNNSAFTDIGDACNMTIDLYECRCSLCLVRENAIKSSISKAKRFVNEAVHNTCAFAYPDNVTQPFKGKYHFFLINLAHLVMVIACLRGII